MRKIGKRKMMYTNERHDEKCSEGRLKPLSHKSNGLLRGRIPISNKLSVLLDSLKPFDSFLRRNRGTSGVPTMHRHRCTGIPSTIHGHTIIRRIRLRRPIAGVLQGIRNTILGLTLILTMTSRLLSEQRRQAKLALPLLRLTIRRYLQGTLAFLRAIPLP